MGGLVSHINTVLSKPRCPWNPFGNQNIFLHSFCSVTIICWARTKCQALTEQSGSGPCTQGIDSRHRSHAWGLSLRERVWAGGECRQLHGHPPPTPDFLCTDRHFLHEPLPGLVRTVIADPPQPSAPLWELVLKGGAETARAWGWAWGPWVSLPAGDQREAWRRGERESVAWSSRACSVPTALWEPLSASFVGFLPFLQSKRLG